MAISANVGARAGDYILARKIGEGGMAEVWLARHYANAQLRALKFLNSNYQGIPEVEARFQNEGESKLIHPNIVRIYEVGQEGGSSFIAMEFVDGHDLENILNSRRGPLTIAESIDIGTQVLAGLGFAHANGIVHRDIKPSNVLVDRDGHAFVMDFGIAKVLGTGRMLTQVNSRLGTPDYMSPEQIRNPRDVDSRSDIYSFGCLFYELLTGWPPFDRGEGYETEHDIKTAHVLQAPTPPVERKTGLPAELNEITLKCLAKAKEDRPQSCDEVIAAIYAYRVAIATPPKPSRAGTLVDSPIQLPETPVAPAGLSAKRAGVDSLGKRNSTMVEGQTPPPTPLAKPLPVIIPQAPVVQRVKANSGGLTSMLVVAAGSLFLLIAAGGGGWVWYHKHQGQSDEARGEARNGTSNETGGNTSGDTNKTAANQTNTPNENRPTGDSPGSGANVETPDTSHASQQPQTNQPAEGSVAPEPGPGMPIVPNATTTDNNGTAPNVQPRPAPSPLNLPSTASNAAPIPRPAPHARLSAPSPLQSSGTLIWSGDSSKTGQQVTIIRSNMSVIQGGSLAGTMFPAGPVRVQVRTPAAATVLAPDPKTNYNSMQLFLAGAGQQTVYIDWTKISER